MKTAGFPHIRENGHYRPAREQAKQREAGAPPGRCERIFVHIRQARRGCCRTEGFGCPSLRPRWECVRGNLRHPSFPTLCRRGHGRRIPPQIQPFASPLLPMRCVRAAYPAANSPVRLAAHRQDTNSTVRLAAPPDAVCAGSVSRRKFSRSPRRASAGQRKIRKNRPQLLTSGDFL